MASVKVTRPWQFLLQERTFDGTVLQLIVFGGLRYAALIKFSCKSTPKFTVHGPALLARIG
jgi:hypothetical protein